MPGGNDGREKGKVRHELSCWIAAVRTHYLVLLCFTLVVYFPQLFLSCFVFFVAQFFRLVARVTGVAGRPAVANKRILVITDYLPPQTHGIAIRVHAYVREMRAKGHEVIVFATAYEADKETSFDHPNIPSLVNPFNLNNRIGYNPGVKLSWYLGAHTWDVVHLVFPSLIGNFVLATCAWRRVPVYCSHHVEMNMFAERLVPNVPVCKFGLFMYNLVGKWPAVMWGTLNSAPTLCFARAHLGDGNKDKLRRAPSGTHDVFSPEPSSSTERKDVRLSRFKVDDESTKVVLMVQRLSGEKGTERIFPVFESVARGGAGVTARLAIAGDGPSRAFLESEARKRKIPAVFLGNVPHHELPQLYRAADCFVTMSLSETFGLTCLEAQMCGCPAVIPHCDVFDEIWGGGAELTLPPVYAVPKDWRYEINSVQQLAAAMKAAQSNGREHLTKEPLRVTWREAAEDLLSQYEECIHLKAESRQTLREFISCLDHLCRLAVCSTIAFWMLNRYWMVLKRFGNTLSPYYTGMGF